VRIAFVLVLVVACGHRVEPAVELADALRPVVGADQATRERTVAQWKLDRTAWTQTVIAPYDTVWEDYARAFDAAVPSLVAQLGAKGDIATRKHFAGDPQLTRGQARARWALPVQFPSELAVLGGAPVDAVFVRTSAGWRAIVGLDAIVIARTAVLDDACARFLDEKGGKACQEVGWEIADAALRVDKTRLAHACSLARTQCAQ
jgi:hypothetical protein